MLPRAKKSYGQNFLVDQSVVRKILSAADIRKGECVLEIGPGTGLLTQALVDAGAQVTAVEADHDLIAPLRETFGDAIDLIEGDVLSAPLSLPQPYKLIANIPYNITSAIIERFLTTEPKPTRMVLMVQREVADRITASPPDMSVLAVACQLYAACKKVTNVPRGAFRPMPKVDSAVVRLDVREGNFEPVIHLAKIGFASRRKQLHRNLSDRGVASSERVKELLTRLGKPETARAETLTTDDWVYLHRFLLNT